MSEESDQGQRNGAIEPKDENHHCNPQDRVVLQVGERRFQTHRLTLTLESPFFKALLSDRWNGAVSADGSYFIDMDPDVFQHILSYLRTSHMPLFYIESGKAFDYGKYAAVLAQARYFGISRMVDWIDNRRYLAAITTKHTLELATGELALAELSSCLEPVQDNIKVEFFPVWDKKKIYICPRSIPVHRGRPEACGARCHKTGPGEFEENHVLKVFVMRREVVFDPMVCQDYVHPEEQESSNEE